MKTYLEPKEIDLIEQAATNLRDRLLIRLLFHLGCRVSEVLGIEVDQIDFNNGTIIIQHLKTRIHLNCPDCSSRLSRNSSYCSHCGMKVEQAVQRAVENRKMRTLPIDKETLTLLREYIDRGGPVLKARRRLLFNVNRHRAWQIIRDCAKKVGLPKLVNSETGKVHNISPHRLRDAFSVMAMKLDDSGDSLRMLQEHLGHASFNTTAKYRKVAGEEHRAWYRKLWEEKMP